MREWMGLGRVTLIKRPALLRGSTVPVPEYHCCRCQAATAERKSGKGRAGHHWGSSISEQAVVEGRSGGDARVVVVCRRPFLSTRMHCRFAGCLPGLLLRL